MSEPSEIAEGRAGVARVEAFSDGVLAIVITIMALELHAPVAPGLDALLALWPTFVAYVLSYAYVAIYWVNHHRLFSHARRVTDGLVWSNIALLFALSLLPFTTAYLGAHFLDPGATVVYAGSLLAPSLAFAWLRRTIERAGPDDAQARRYHIATARKGAVATGCYLAAAVLGWRMPAVGVAVAGLVALFWIKPWGRMDSVFLRCDSPSGGGGAGR